MINKIKKVLTESCILFTVFTFLLYCIGYVAVSDTITLTMGSIASLFGSCILLCILRRILYVKSISMPLRIVLHYILVLGSAFLLFAVIGKVVTTSLASLVMLAIVTLIYSIIVLLHLLLTRKDENSEEYTSMFKK